MRTVRSGSDRRRVGKAAWIAMLSVLAWATGSEAQTAAYQGFGATTPGGAGGQVVHVTNLNDSGPGSLRAALSQGNRTVVFDVAGEMVLADYLTVSGAFVTIDGFTAPSPGITLRNRGLLIRGTRGAHDVIVRGIRVRSSAIDGIQVAYGAYNVLIDHVSVAGSLDGNIDITEGSHDVTVSWSILAGNEKNMLVKYNPSRVTLHHNIFTESLNRNPQLRIDDAGGVATRITGDVRNNVVANWANGYGTLLYYGVWANLVNNYYTASQKAIMLSSARAYVAGNLSADGVDLNGVGNETSAFPSAPVTTQDGCTAARLVLAGAGVRPLDSLDQRYVARIPVPSCPGPSSSLEVSPTALPFDATVGGLTPLPQQVTIVEEGGGSLSWVASATTASGEPWLVVTPPGGTTPSVLTVSPDPGGLPEGIHEGTVVVSAPGAANSPRSVAVTLVVDAAPSEEGRVTAGIAAGPDDGREYSTGAVRTGEGYIHLGRRNLVVLRFRDVNVPRGAVIQSAVVGLYGVGTLASSVALRYTAEDSGDSAPLTTADRSLSSRSRTRAFVDDTPDPWTLGVFNASADLRALLQEVVERADWGLGNSLTIFIEDQDSAGARRIGSFEGSPSASQAARLTILYQVP